MDLKGVTLFGDKKAESYKSQILPESDFELLYSKILFVNHNTAWERKFGMEISNAEKARKEGNEGRARVCARRAAGVVIIEYLTQKGIKLSRPSALNALRTLSDAVEEDDTVQQVAEHFIWHITPEHTLPDDIDLLEEARWLAAKLLGDRRDSP